LVEASTFLGHEVTATLRLWCRPQGPLLPELLRPGLVKTAQPEPDGSIALWPDGLKTGLEDQLLSAGVDLVYGSRPVGLEIGQGRLAGLVIANKSGRQSIAARKILDATDEGTVARLAGGVFEPVPPEPYAYRGIVEFDGVRTDIAASSDDLRLRPGCRGAGHVLVEFGFQHPLSADAAGGRSLSARLRAAGIGVAERLLCDDPAFEGAWLAAISALPYGQLNVPLRTSRQRTGFDGPLDAIFCLQVTSDATVRAQLTDPVSAIHCGQTVATVLSKASPVSTVAVAERNVPLAQEVDVLVVGGGSSGAAAAITAARGGARTLLVDANPGLGGTGTYGGVDSYWYGRPAGFNTELRALVSQLHRRLGMRRRNGKWNLEAKIQVLHDTVESAGAEFWTGATAVDALREGSRVVGATFATSYGPMAVQAAVVIDATGDGDIAAFAGADYDYGEPHTGTVMWYSLAQFAEPGRTRNNFGGAVDVSDIRDLTRAVLAGRRRGSDLHDHGIYVATRESRHIRGDVTLTLTDQLTRRRWPDVVNVHFSNHDIKGKSESVWPLVGLIPPNLLIEVPYRALLPAGLDGILVVGKAFSATHDAIPALRMQADLENLGAAAGIAAAQCVATGVLPREVDTKALQQRLVRAGYLEFPTQSAPASRRPDELADAVAANAPLYRYNDMGHRDIHDEGIPFVDAVTRPGDSVGRALIAALDRHCGAGRLAIAQALALRRDSHGIRIVVDELVAMLAGDQLPRQSTHIRNSQLAPDHAAMPAAAYLLYTLAFARTPLAIPIWQRTAELLVATYELMWDGEAGLFAYVDAICAGAQRLADPAAVPILRRLHAADCLHDQHRVDVEPDIVRERLAMLELSIGRALLRCGAPAGVDILLRYLSDARTLLAAQARRELAAIGAGDFGAVPVDWARARDRLRAAVRPHPVPPDVF
jgi:glycine/D-amino acid oxidase-like deaminating enzyme